MINYKYDVKRVTFYKKVINMKEFLEKSLQQNVIMTENKEVYKKLPLAYRGRYNIFTVEMNGVLWMAIHPKEDVGLVMLRRDRAGVEKMTGLNCAIFLDRTTFYIKEKMMEEGIPFVIEGKQVFLPFIGYLLSKENEREFEINLDFLKDGRTYRVTSFEDGINAGYQAMDYRMKSATMNKNQKLSVKMARNGGFAAVLE